ncbi:membrane-bound PQQ-dependent dehydrogenase, glucose/quinate/shikimate family [Marinomonas piezotolerans]|uniref:Membrane-bound PQQ-dependent dehydrogenase, glucose/quinate/shikimate family n=1 Tax=Marinomonas piezotolerans TaxID=2213058 RepID=A0A370UBU1_9GAMM|nr:glucose/quinate/shikimate family membrane-bound PQQ-dependent dehydrogenase [Marinomonas piezotolerans]RDL45211.1 membrane-bound PQQ-dependent dehydrogenase, glucose/quinate/shikimate family [Marinomonas piezotolerans]
MFILSILFFLIGIVLTAGGIWLLALDGSPYYVISGVLLLAVSFTLRRHRVIANALYAVLLLGTMIWSLWESGFDWWPLASRMGTLLVLALPLLIFVGRKGRVSQRLLLPVWGICAVATLSPLAMDDPTAIKGTMADRVVNPSAATGLMGDSEWHAYGRSNLGQRYSPVNQITPDNVSDLELAWQYQTGDVKGPKDVGETTYEATPLKIGNALYLCTPHNWLVALNADTGEEMWVYDAKVPPESQRQHQTCRGVSYLPTEDESKQNIAKKQTQPAQQLASMQCDAQLFLPTSDARLLAVDPETGARCANFADDGVLDLMHNMPFKQSGYYYSTSPPLVAGGKVIVAGAVNDNYDINSPSGVIRAYDAKTGQLQWNWDAGHPEDTSPIGPDETYAVSSPNSWSVASADEELGLAYFPMGNRTPDQLGMYRSPADEKYSSSVVALSLETGQPEWVQQFVHHDLWDMDTPAQPVLLDLNTDKGVEPALVVPTKQGDVYVLHRGTGEAIFPITEEPAPQGAVPGDFTAKTQPTSAISFKPDPLTEADMWGATPIDQMLCRIEFNSLDYKGRYTPPSENGAIVFPGNFGVFNWGSVAVDPKRQVMFGMPLYLAFTSTLVPKDQELGETNQGEQGLNENAGAQYAVEMAPFLSPLGVPCQQPPWGYVAGVDLRTGKTAWKHKNGTVEDLTPLALPIKMGVPGIGGPIITDGGVVFMAASVDDYIRAYDLNTGAQIWQHRLPAGGQATPMTYLNSQGEQMVVQVAGGHGSIGTTIGDYVVAYKLAK